MSELNTDETYSSTEVCDQLGIAYRQLYHWMQMGYIEAPPRPYQRSGYQFRWTSAQVERLREIHEALEEIYAIAARVGIRLFDRGTPRKKEVV